MFRIVRLAACVATLVLTGWGPAQAKNCKLIRLASLDALVDARDMFFVPVKIVDKTFYMLLDTGAATSMITKDVADSLHLSISASMLMNGKDSNGNLILGTVTVPSLKIGNLEGEGFEFLVLVGQAIRTDDASKPEFGGILGANFLTSYDVEIDPAQKKVNFFKQNDCDGNVVYWADDYDSIDILTDGQNHMFADVIIDNQKITSLVDTGASSSAIDFSLANSLFGISLDEAKRLPKDNGLLPSGKFVPVYLYHFKSLDFGMFSFSNPPVDIMSLSASNERGGRMLFGMTQLKMLHLYIAYGDRKIYATTADAHR